MVALPQMHFEWRNPLKQAFSLWEKDALFSGRQANPKDLLCFSR